MAVSWMVLIMRSLRWCRGEYLEGDDDAVEVADYDDDGDDDYEVFEMRWVVGGGVFILEVMIMLF